MFDVREYLDADGRSPFADWFVDLDATAAAKVTVAIARIEQGTLSAFKGVGGECLSIGSTSALAIECISGWTVTRW
jgi:hypothetical protein